MNFEKLMSDHIEWTSTTFPNGTSIGALLHAHREVDEIIEDIKSGAPNPIKAKEYADALFCIIDSAHREGITLSDIITEGNYGLTTNKARIWKDNGDGSYSHVK